jgi:hypothetical protein
LLFLSGRAPLIDGDVGKVGREWDAARCHLAPHLTALNMLATLKAELDELDRVRRAVELP